MSAVVFQENITEIYNFQRNIRRRSYVDINEGTKLAIVTKSLDETVDWTIN